MPRAGQIAAAGVFAAGCAGALWVLWGPVIEHTARGGSLELCLKNFYAPDQYSVLGIARNAQDGASVYSDPFTGTGDSFYPAEYYRLLGTTAELTDTSVVWSWNVVGLAVSGLLIALAVAWARRVAPGSSAWALAPGPFLLGTLYWWGSGTWSFSSGDAVLWPPFASLYSPGAEAPALLLTGLALLALLCALSATGRRRLAWALGAGAAAGLSLQVHANVAVFCGVAAVLVAVWDDLIHLATPARRRAAAAGAAALVVIAVAAPPSGVGLRLLAAVAAAALFLLTDARWRRERGGVAAVAVVAAALASLPLSARLAAELASGGGYIYDRQASVGVADVHLPVLTVLVLWLPLWLTVGGVAWWLARRARAADPAWLPSLAGIATATGLLTFAGRLETSGLEWHRFLIYGTFLTALAAVPALWLMVRDAPEWRERGVGLGLAAVLVATLPTAVQFAWDQRGVITCTPPEEAAAFASIGRLAGRDRIVLLDSCFAHGPFRVHSGARTMFVNLGIAAPRDRDLVLRVLNEIRARELPGASELRDLGVTSFLTNDRCGGVARAAVRAAFGPATAAVPLPDAERLGFPEGLRYELYDLPAGGRRPPPDDGDRGGR